jgi:predicted unusual protein kinase regulating ubiquinone biosynthesis (AarF/ABC1/UbiB family)
MDYIEGIKINQIKEEDYEGFAKLVVKFGLVTTIVHGVTHGDLHSGNVLFIKDSKDVKYPHKIGVIDFGIIYNVNTKYKGVLFDIFTKLFDMPPRECAEKLLHSGIIEPPEILNQIPKADYESILHFTTDIISDTIHGSKQANQMQVYKFLSTLKDYLSKKELMNLGIRPGDDFVKSQLVMAMAHGVTLSLCKGDYINLMDKCLNELFHTQMII